MAAALQMWRRQITLGFVITESFRNQIQSLGCSFFCNIQFINAFNNNQLVTLPGAAGDPAAPRSSSADWSASRREAMRPRGTAAGRTGSRPGSRTT